MSKVLMKGNEAIAEAAIRAGCEAYFGYPITPQTEVLEYMSRRMPKSGARLPAGRERAGRDQHGLRRGLRRRARDDLVLQPRHQPDAGDDLLHRLPRMVPAVIVNIMRGGPGLGNIQPAQADYLQMTKGGGHGDYRVICLAPATVQEVVDHVILAFDLADKYRQPVMVIADGMIGQMMEPVELPEMGEPCAAAAALGAHRRQGPAQEHRHLALPRAPKSWSRSTCSLQAMYRADRGARESATRRICSTTPRSRWSPTAPPAASPARPSSRRAHKGIKVGLFRPISVYPFPYERAPEAGRQASARLLVVEMSAGQMLEDVRLALCGAVPIHFYGRIGGIVPLPDEVLAQIEAIARSATDRRNDADEEQTVSET